MRLSQQVLSPAAVRIPPDDLSPDAKAAWRYLRDHGGYYSAAELAKELLPMVSHVKGAQSAGRWLLALLRRGHVALNPLSTRSNRYGVTTRCFPIPGESLDPAELSTPAHQA